MSGLGASTLDTNDLGERDRLILEQMPQVKWIAVRMHEKTQGRVELDDLISAGTLGLIAAVDRFDPARNLQIKTYAEHKIRGAMVDYLRSLDSLSLDDRQLAKETSAARAKLEHQFQRTATHAEVAREMGLGEKEYGEAVTLAGAHAPFSLDAVVKHADGGLRFSDVMPDLSSMSPEQQLTDSELHGLVSEAIIGLEHKTGTVIALHYAHGLTMRKIASMLDLSEWQVQERRRKAIGELRIRLAPMCGGGFLAGHEPALNGQVRGLLRYFQGVIPQVVRGFRVEHDSDGCRGDNLPRGIQADAGYGLTNRFRGCSETRSGGICGTDDVAGQRLIGPDQVLYVVEIGVQIAKQGDSSKDDGGKHRKAGYGLRQAAGVHAVEISSHFANERIQVA